MAYGSPERLADVPAYYSDIRGGRPIAPEHLADLVERYRRLGIEDSSPLNAITEQTRAALEAELELPVFTGMKHWTPRIAEAADLAVCQGSRPSRRARAGAALLGPVDRGLPRSARACARRPRRAALRRQLARRARLRRTARGPGSRHRQTRRLHRPLAACPDHPGGGPVPRPAPRDVAARRRGGRPRGVELLLPERVADGRAVARAGHSRSPRVAAAAGRRARPRLPRRFRVRPSGDSLGHRCRGAGEGSRAGDGSRADRDAERRPAVL